MPPDKKAGLPQPPLLRTARAPFNASRSSNFKRPAKDAAVDRYNQGDELVDGSLDEGG